jgi:23S rRNA (adenine2503-C2)-methyltransferase
MANTLNKDTDLINSRLDVFKRIHTSKAETCIKTVDEVSTEKSTVFISSSVGCALKCKFCHLTLKGHTFKKLNLEDILENTEKAVNWAALNSDKINKKTLKLSWMGMGDAFFNLDNVLKGSEVILQRTTTKGLDKIDISTTLPKSVNASTFNKVHEINAKYDDKVRWFYSVFSAVEQTRSYMIPETCKISEAVNMFRENGMRIIAHQIFLNGVNDSNEEVKALVDFINENSDVFNELRVLRYNECENSWWYESDNYTSIIEYLNKYVDVKVKSQVSPGKEIKAACGMFHEI